jgi:hypothetical protein
MKFDSYVNGDFHCFQTSSSRTEVVEGVKYISNTFLSTIEESGFMGNCLNKVAALFTN